MSDTRQAARPRRELANITRARRNAVKIASGICFIGVIAMAFGAWRLDFSQPGQVPNQGAMIVTGLGLWVAFGGGAVAACVYLHGWMKRICATLAVLIGVFVVFMAIMLAVLLPRAIHNSKSPRAAEPPVAGANPRPN